MSFNRGCTQLGRAVSAMVDFAVEINFIADTAKVISSRQDFAHLNRVKTYSAFMETMRSSMVYSEDYTDFDAGFCLENVVTAMCDGDNIVVCELRLMVGKKKKPVWYSAKFIRVNGDEEFNGRVVLVIANIEHHKEVEERAEQLSEWVERDPLTGLYNKKAAQSIIDAYLNGEGKNSRHTILFCDLDDFKAVNDTYGHPLGDALLSSVVSRFSQTFRREDILCRIGGDEFVVLMKGASGHSYVSHRVNLLLERMSQPIDLGEHQISVTMSVGIASYPECGGTYADLLNSADKAMYVAKFNGKNRYCFHDDVKTGAEESGSVNEEIPAAEPRTSYKVRGKIGDYIFNSLYESTDISKTMNLVLQLMGTHFGLGRVAVAEFKNDVMHIIRQWNANGVKELQQPIDYSGELRAMFEGSRSCENMALRYDDIGHTPAEVRKKLAAAGIDDVYAFLNCPLLDNGVIRGYIAFYDCSAPRKWSEEERDTLSFVSRLISLFVFKQQDYERTLQAYKLTHHAVNGSPLSLTVVNKDTYELIYISEKARQESPEAKEGDICYQALFNYEKPCDFCPMKLLEGKECGETCTQEHFFKEQRKWVVFSASGIELEEGVNACLCGRVDTTQYKTREFELEDENARLRARLAELTKGDTETI